MSLRSPALAALGLLLIASAGVLGALLVHDGEVDAAPDLAHAQPGEPVRLKGEPEAFAPGLPVRAWRSITPLLANHTYSMADPAGFVVLLTSERPAPSGTVLADGVVSAILPHPDRTDQLLVVVAVAEWQEPILFR